MARFRSKTKRILFILLALVLLYLGWLGVLLLRFKPFSRPPSGSPEIEGVYHIHTKLSDGMRTPEALARIASHSGLDFIILTDHGKPNYKSLASEGWKEGVLVLAGSELSVSRGHLVGLGFNPPPKPFSQNAEQAVHEIGLQGGFSIIAHPYSKTQWSWGKHVDYSGLELINGDTMLKRKLFSSIPYLPALLVKPEYTMIKMLDRPTRNLKKWDELNTIHPTYGYFSADAHLMYGPLFSVLRLHLPLSRPLSPDFEEAKGQVLESLRKGNFYNAIDAAGAARGFRFWAVSGDQTHPMGQTINARGPNPVSLEVRAPFPFAKEIRLIYNGNVVLSSSEDKVSFRASDPGTYRVEIHLRGRTPLARGIPWIVSNPIFLRKDSE